MGAVRCLVWFLLSTAGLVFFSVRTCQVLALLTPPLWYPAPRSSCCQQHGARVLNLCCCYKALSLQCLSVIHTRPPCSQPVCFAAVSTAQDVGVCRERQTYPTSW